MGHDQEEEEKLMLDDMGPRISGNLDQQELNVVEQAEQAHVDDPQRPMRPLRVFEQPFDPPELGEIVQV